jgi:type IV pilus assembly protein PilW
MSPVTNRKTLMTTLKDQSGLTLLELLIALVISGILLAGMMMTFWGQSRSYNNQQEITALQENMWAALQLMSRDIRMAGYDPTGKAFAGIVTATSSTFQATADLNGNGVLATGSPPTPEPNENITYSLTGTTLNRTIGASVQPVINNITNLAFEYKTAISTGVTSPWTWAWKDSVTGSDLTTIKVVKICMQGRSEHETSIRDTSSYKPTHNTGSTFYDWTPAFPKRYQFRTMCVEIKCRNR